MKPDRSSAERGQILILFALSLVAIIGMVGLVLDSGSSFAQKRVEQNAADVAALAAAHDLIANQGSANWDATARSVAGQNGYTHGVDGAVVEVTCVNCPGAGPNQTFDATVDGVQVTVNITAPHRNNFAGIFGMTTWDVSTTATSKTGWANTAHGPGPFIVSVDAFNAGGNPIHCTGPIDECDLQNYLDGSADFTVTLDFGCYIAQHNDGVMNNIVADLAALAPTSFPVPIVDDQGKYVGWASFVMTSASPGGRNGIITGYFETGRIVAQLDVQGAGFGSSSFGSAYVVQLVN